MPRPPVVAAFATALTAAAVVTACGPSHHPGALASPTSSVVKADETQAAQILSQCMPKNVLTLTTQSGRQALVRCLAIPPAKRPAFSTCLTTATEADHLLTHAGRAKFAEVSLPACVKANR
jgi:hypothetical protein